MSKIIRAALNENGTLVKQTIDIHNLTAGYILPWPGTTAPEHTLICDGSAISRVTYAALFAVIGTTYGAGDGSTTFALPDFRGYFLRGANGTNSAAMGTAQQDAIRNITGNLGMRPFLNPTWTEPETLSVFAGATVPGVFNTSDVHTETVEYAIEWAIQATNSGFPYDHIHCVPFDASRVVPTDAEVRPVNYAVNWVIVYE